MEGGGRSKRSRIRREGEIGADPPFLPACWELGNSFSVVSDALRLVLSEMQAVMSSRTGEEAKRAVTLDQNSELMQAEKQHGRKIGDEAQTPVVAVSEHAGTNVVVTETKVV